MTDLSLIKKLRETTGCGIADCSKALKECNDDFEKSIDWLRKKGLSSAGKKSGRITSEGLVAINIDGNKGSVIEVNSETDFVARNQKFQDFVRNIAKVSFAFGEDLEKLKASKYPHSSFTIEEELKNQIGVIGENINIRRISSLSVENGIIVSYIHNSIADNLGKIAVLVALESNGDKTKLENLGKQIAMHIAAAKPDALDIKAVDQNKLNREIDILKEQTRNSGKAENIIEKMMEGRIRKYYEEVVLLEQNFVINDKIKIKDLVTNFSKEISTPVAIKGFRLFILGEGIEKKENDFASEVADLTKSS